MKLPVLPQFDPSAVQSDCPGSLKISGLGKRFGSLAVLRGVDCTLDPGKIYGVFGPNGAGKSTLLKILAGILPFEAGQIMLNEQRISFGRKSAKDRFPVSYISQQPVLIDSWTVREFIAYVAGADSLENCQTMMLQFDVSIAPNLAIASLTIEERQILSICASLTKQSSIYLLDEPTTGLDSDQRNNLYKILKARADAGALTLVVSHDLERLALVCDEFLLVEGGKVLPSPLEENLPKRNSKPFSDPPNKHLILNSEKFGSIGIARGEIVGLTGTIRTGASDFLRSVFGLNSSTQSISLDGQAWNSSLVRSFREGIVYLSRDREREWGFYSHSMAFNMAVRLSAQQHRLIINRRDEEREILDLIEAAGVRPALPEMPFMEFSGGNRQKGLIAASMAAARNVLLLDEPLSGVDNEARRWLEIALREFVSKSRIVVIFSQEIADLQSICDRTINLDAEYTRVREP